MRIELTYYFLVLMLDINNRLPTKVRNQVIQFKDYWMENHYWFKWRGAFNKYIYNSPINCKALDRLHRYGTGKSFINDPIASEVFNLRGAALNFYDWWGVLNQPTAWIITNTTYILPTVFLFCIIIVGVYWRKTGNSYRTLKFLDKLVGLIYVLAVLFLGFTTICFFIWVLSSLGACYDCYYYYGDGWLFWRYYLSLTPVYTYVVWVFFILFLKIIRWVVAWLIKNYDPKTNCK